MQHIVTSILSLADIFDYSEYLKAAILRGGVVIPFHEYFSVVGRILAAKNIYKTMAPEDAYDLFLIDLDNSRKAQTFNTELQNTEVTQTKCGGCGGGIVV